MSLPERVCAEIADALGKYKLLDWIDEKELDYNLLSENPNAIDYLEKHPKKIHWSILSKNRNAIKLLRENRSKIDIKNFYENPEVIAIIEENIEKHKKAIFSYHYT